MNGQQVQRYILALDTRIIGVWQEYASLGKSAEPYLLAYLSWKDRWDAFAHPEGGATPPVGDEEANRIFGMAYRFSMELDGDPAFGDGWRQRLQRVSGGVVSAPGEGALPVPTDAPATASEAGESFLAKHWGKLAIGAGIAGLAAWWLLSDSTPDEGPDAEAIASGAIPKIPAFSARQRPEPLLPPQPQEAPPRPEPEDGHEP